MKNIIKIIVLLTYLSIGSSTILAQEQIFADYKYIDIKPLQSFYSLDDTIHLSLTSKIDSMEILYVVISLDEKLESGWVQVLDDVFAKIGDDAKFKNSKLVFRQTDTTLNFSVTKLKEKILDLISDTQYRFCIEVRDTPLRIIEQVYSSPFALQ